MNKIIISIILQIIFIQISNAEEPILAILENVISNKIQKLSVGNNSFYCKAYGVVAIEDLMKNNSSKSVCLISINNLYKKTPSLRYFSINLLKVKQMYRVEFKKDGCILYARGQKTLSEFLLEEGLATGKLRFKDKEFKYSFIKAELRAKMLKKGIWRENIRGKCLAELVK
jgi:hypothetical protein